MGVIEDLFVLSVWRGGMLIYSLKGGMNLGIICLFLGG